MGLGTAKAVIAFSVILTLSVNGVSRDASFIGLCIIFAGWISHSHGK